MHKIEFYAEFLSSGVYFYRIDAVKFRVTMEPIVMAKRHFSRGERACVHLLIGREKSRRRKWTGLIHASKLKGL